jgi:hypothetical protein
MVELPTVWIDQQGSKVRATRDSLRMLASAGRLWIHHLTMPIGPDAPDETLAAHSPTHGVDALAS